MHLCERPQSSAANQRSANTLAACLRFDEPPFEVRHSVTPATLRTPSNREFREADHAPHLIFSKQYDERCARLTSEEAFDLLAVLGFGAIGPERETHSEPWRGVSAFRWSYRDHLKCCRLTDLSMSRGVISCHG